MSVEKFLKDKQSEFKTDAFKNWFKNSKVTLTDSLNIPKMLYHGTTFDFKEFKVSHKENFVGSGYYFSDSIADVNENYAGMGPDLKNRIESVKTALDNELSNISFKSEWDEIIDTFELYLFYEEDELKKFPDLIEESEYIWLRVEKENKNLIEKLNDKKELKESNLITYLKNNNILNQYTQIPEKDYDLLIECSDFSEKMALKLKKGNHDGFIMPCYLSMQNPFYLSKNGTKLYFEITFNEIEDLLSEYDFISEVKKEIMSQNYTLFAIDDVGDVHYFNKDLFIEINEDILEEINEDSEKNYELFIEALDKIEEDELTIKDKSNGYEFINNLTTLLNEKTDFSEEEIKNILIEKEIVDYFDENNALTVFNKLKKSHLNEELMDVDYHMGQIFREVIEMSGYDGIIMNCYDSGLTNMKGIDKMTNHYITFNTSQIKSAYGNCGQYSLDIPDIAAKITYDSYYFKDHINKQEIEDYIKEAFINYKGKKPDLYLYDSPEKAGKKFQDKYDLKNRLDPESGGVMLSKDNALLIFTDNIKRKDEIDNILVHEILGHWTTRQRFEKNQLIELLQNIYKEYKDDELMDDIAKTYLFNKNNLNHQVALADEFIAHRAEIFKEPSLKQKIKKAMNDKLSETGLTINKHCDMDMVDKLLYENHLFNHNLTIEEDIKNTLTKKKKKYNKIS